MLPALRRSHIMAAARERGGVSVRELSRRLHVSAPTIRRDLSALVDRGLLARVHGGAVAVDQASPLAPVAAVPWRATEAGATEAWPADGCVTGPAGAAALVAPGMAVGISAGTSAVALARAVRDVVRLTVVTPAPAVAEVMRGYATVVMLGGVRTPGGSHAGPLAVLALRWLNLDVAFVEVRRGPGGYGLDDPEAVETTRALLACAARRVLLAGAPSATALVSVEALADLLAR